MIGNVSSMTGAFPGFAAAAGATIAARTLLIPMRFTFNRESGTYLPIIAMPRSQVRLEFEFSPLNELIRGDIDAGSYSLGSTVVIAEYVHLTDSEREMIANAPHAILFEQVQEGGQEFISGKSLKHKPEYAHPVKLIVWVLRRADNMDPSANTNMDWFNFTGATGSTGNDPLDTGSISFNNKKRVEEIGADYFRDYQAFYHLNNSGCPGLYTYAYGLKPLIYNPTGTMNYSAIESSAITVNTTADLDGVSKTLDSFAFSYNVLRVRKGVAGVSYAT